MSIETGIAEEYLAAKLSVLPAVREKKCPAVGKWKVWQERLPTDVEVRAWFANRHDAICLICGKISGNLEILDFDNHGELFPKWKELIPQELFEKLVIEQTPSGGFHAAYRCSDEICGNLKLAQGERDGKLVTLIETRGNGGLFLCYPTDGYTLKQAAFTSLQILSSEERKQLFDAAYSLNEKTQGEAKEPPDITDSDLFEERPGDDFNERGDIRDLLICHGWTPVRVDDGNEYFRRPNKSGTGWSASLKDRVFYVFTSNAYPFEPNKAYSPFNVYTLLEHHGDYTAAANTLLQYGYGKARETPLVNLSPFLSQVSSAAPLPPQQSSIRSLDELMTEFPEMKPVLIHGLLRIGETMNIIAPPKTGKSWLVTDLAAAVATGSPWFGYPCEQGKVLIIDNELHPETSANRIPKVINARNYPMSIVQRNLFVENQRGFLRSIYDLKSRLAEIKEHGFKLIIIDAFYRAMPAGMEENDNAKMAEIYNRLDSYAAELNCAFVLIHHTSKGNQANKSVTDVGAGAGSQSRAADAHIILRRHTEENAVVMDAVVRSFPPVMPIGLRWNYPLWNYDMSLDTDALDGKLEEPASKKEKPLLEDLAEQAAELLETPMMKMEFSALLQMKLKISKHVATDVIECAKALEMIEENYFRDPNDKMRHGKLLSRTPLNNHN